MGSKARIMLATAGEARIGRLSHQLCYKVNWGGQYFVIVIVICK